MPERLCQPYREVKIQTCAGCFRRGDDSDRWDEARGERAEMRFEAGGTERVIGTTKRNARKDRILQR
jgi:hypothetical protein